MRKHEGELYIPGFGSRITRKHHALVVEDRTTRGMRRVLGGLSRLPIEEGKLAEFKDLARDFGYLQVGVEELFDNQLVEQLDPPLEVIAPDERHIRYLVKIHNCGKSY